MAPPVCPPGISGARERCTHPSLRLYEKRKRKRGGKEEKWGDWARHHGLSEPSCARAFAGGTRGSGTFSYFLYRYCFWSWFSCFLGLLFVALLVCCFAVSHASHHITAALNLSALFVRFVRFIHLFTRHGCIDGDIASAYNCARLGWLAGWWCWARG